MTTLLDVHDLTVRLPGRHGLVTIVDHVEYAVEGGSVFGLAGESGSGKTLSLLALVGLLPRGASVEGRATFRGQNLLALAPNQLRGVRGRHIGMVFQDPLASLHPMLSIGTQITEHMRCHLRLSAPQARRRAANLLAELRIPDPERALRAYPHQFSGGMRQRVSIAIGLACEPELLIADEPTTALDVTVQAGLLRILDEVRRRVGTAIILVSHDLGVLSAVADHLTVLYAGRVVESGPTHQVLSRPRHPYTAGLLSAVPLEAEPERPPRPIPGSPPGPAERPAGCAFHPRCTFAVDECRTRVPALISVPENRRLACPPDPLVGARELADARNL